MIRLSKQLRLQRLGVGGSLEPPINLLTQAQAHWNGGLVGGGLWLLSDSSSNFQQVGNGLKTEVTDGSTLGWRADIRSISGTFSAHLAQAAAGVLGTREADNLGYTHNVGDIWDVVAGSNFYLPYKNTDYDAGDLVEIRWTITNWTAGPFGLRAGTTGQTPTFSANGDYVAIVRASSNDLYFMGSGLFTGTVSNIETRKLSGNHLVSPTIGQAGTWDLDGGRAWQTDDGVDDERSTGNDLGSGLSRIIFAWDSSDTQGVMGGSTSAAYFGKFLSGGVGTALDLNIGTPTYYKDGVIQTPTTEGDMYTLFCTGSPVMVEVANADLDDAAVASFGLNTYGGAQYHSSKYGGVAVIPESEITSNALVRTHLYDLIAHRAGLPALSLLLALWGDHSGLFQLWGDHSGKVLSVMGGA